MCVCKYANTLEFQGNLPVHTETQWGIPRYILSSSQISFYLQYSVPVNIEMIIPHVPILSVSGFINQCWWGLAVSWPLHQKEMNSGTSQTPKC